MSDHEMLQAMLPILNAIPREQLRRPTVPVRVVLQESENLYKWALEDRKALLSVGLDWHNVEDLPARSDVLRVAQGSWAEQRFNQKQTEASWAEAATEGYRRRDELLRATRYAYSEDDRLLRHVSIIADGNSNADMIQDLTDLAILGQRHLEPLQAINFEIAKLQQALDLASELADKYAEAIRDRNKDKEGKILRDRAHTHVKQAVDAIYAAGQYVFWDNPERLQGYRSQYKRQRRSVVSDANGNPIDNANNNVENNADNAPATEAEASATVNPQTPELTEN